MSYQFPQQQAPRRKGGGGLFFLIILGVGAFLLFSRLGTGPAGDGIGRQPAEQSSTEPLDNDYARQPSGARGSNERDSKVGQAMPSTGGTGAAKGWELEDVTAQHDQSNPPMLRPKDAKTQKGDWAIEEVDGKKPAGNQFKFSDPNPSAPAKPGGDWSIENVEPKNNAKTEQGDWAIEETNAIQN